MAGGSFFGAVAMSAVILIAALGITWGVLNQMANKPVATPATAPAAVDRAVQDLDKAAPAPAPAQVRQADPDLLQFAPPYAPVQAKPFVGDSIVDKPDLTTPRKTHTTHPRHFGPR
jgi:hypothetical protein